MLLVVKQIFIRIGDIIDVLGKITMQL